MLDYILALGTGLLVVVVAIIFVPAVIAFMRGHSYKWIILVLCVATFITGITWIVALVWAVWPSNKSLADPVLGNVTGTGQRNAGDTIGSVQHGIERGREQEKFVAVAAVVTPAPAATVKVNQPLLVNHDTRECPHCAETIKAAAKLCRFCKSTVEPLFPAKEESVESNWVSLVEPEVQTPQVPVLTEQPTTKTPNSADFTWSVGGTTISKPAKAVEPEVKPMTAERSPAVKPQRTESEALRVQNLWALGFVTLVVILGLVVLNHKSLAITPTDKTVSSSVTPPASARTTSITLANGESYKGEVTNGQPHGQGVLTAADGNREWKGTFVNGRLEGKASFVNKSSGYTFTGEFKDGKIFGQGAETFPSGEKFSGWFEDGKRNGFGTHTYADGKKWSGMYKDGKAVP
jgi:hypothetical protein